MKTQSLAYCVTGVLVALFVTGCKSDGVDGDHTGSISVGGKVFAKQADGTPLTAADAYGEGDKLSADKKTAKQVVANLDGKTVSPAESTSFSIVRNDDDSVDVTVGGSKQHFTESDLEGGDTPFGAEKTDKDGNYYEIYSTFSDLNEIDQGTGKRKYANLWGYYFPDPEAGLQRRGFAAVGTETRPADVTAQPNASYDGDFFAEAYDAKPEQNGSRTQVTGAVHLDANFADGTISGSVANLATRDRVYGDGDSKPNYVARNGKLLMNSAKISGNGYSGTMSANAAAKTAFEVDNLAGSTYSGKFYGPEANETAGVVGLHVNNADGTTNEGVGGFAATKTPNP